MNDIQSSMNTLTMNAEIHGVGIGNQINNSEYFNNPDLSVVNRTNQTSNTKSIQYRAPMIQNVNSAANVHQTL